MGKKVEQKNMDIRKGRPRMATGRDYRDGQGVCSLLRARKLLLSSLALVVTAFLAAVGCRTGRHAKNSPTENRRNGSTNDGESEGANPQDRNFRKLIFSDEVPDLDEVQRVESQFREYLRGEVLPANILKYGGYSRLQKAMDKREREFNELESEYHEILTRASKEKSRFAFAFFRIGQLYFDYGCQLQNLEFPESEDQKKLKSITGQLVDTLFRKARKVFDHANTFPSPWAEMGVRVAADIPVDAVPLKRAGELCAKYRRLWASPEALTDARIEDDD